MFTAEQKEYVKHIKEMTDEVLANELEDKSSDSQVNSAWDECPSHWQFDLIVEEIWHRTCMRDS